MNEVESLVDTHKNLKPNKEFRILTQPEDRSMDP